MVLERFYENHPFGSSHGGTRILRTAYAEGPVFVPLVLRARHLWRQVGRESGEEIFLPRGVLLAGRPGSVDLRGAARSARRYRLPHEIYDDGRASARFPGFRFVPGDQVLWDPRGGILLPERAIRTFRRGASRRGVRFRWNSPVVRWRSRPDGRLLVRTRTREYLARRVVLAVGSWLPRLVPELHLPLQVEQQTVFWFRPPRVGRGPLQRMPAFVWYGTQGQYFYGTPDLGHGVKVGGSKGQWLPGPYRRPATSSREARAVRGFVRDRLPALYAQPIDQAQCLYTKTPDLNFLIDLHPENSNLVLASACSGHGFKFVSALGELIARGLVTGTLPSPLAPFRRRPRAWGVPPIPAGFRPAPPDRSALN